MSFATKHQKRIEEDEKELEELIAKGKPPEGEEGEEEVKPEGGVPDENLSEEEKTFKKRYGDLRRHSQKQAEEFKARIEALEKKLEEKPDTAPVEIPKNKQEMLEWKEKYPSVAGIIETMIREEAEAMFKDAKMSLEDIQNKQKESEKTKAIKKIIETHPDFEELQDSIEFQDWADEQPRWVQVALFEQSDDPKSVIRAIDLYKMDLGVKNKPKADQEEKRKAAGAIDTKGGRASVDDKDAGGKIKESVVSRMSMKEYAANEEKIMEAIRTGNFVYDISGGAR
jgi:hypothetical protein